MVAVNLIDALLDTMEGDVGKGEVPPGSNRGPWLDEVVLDPYGTWMHGQPWCAAYRGSALRRIGVDRWAYYASPSTYIMCQRAREHGWLVAPMPGAAIVRCGVHVETLVSHISAGLWNTIGGNTSDAVSQRVRDVTEWDVCFLEPELLASWKANPGRGDAPAVEFYFYDRKPERTKQGGFATRADRRAWIEKLSPDWQSRASLWHNAQGFGVTIGPRVLYGPFRSRGRRNARREAIAALYHDPVTDFAAFRVEHRADGTAVSVPAVPTSIAARVGLGPATGTAQPDDLGKTT